MGWGGPAIPQPHPGILEGKPQAVGGIAFPLVWGKLALLSQVLVKFLLPLGKWLCELQEDRLRGLLPSPHPDPWTVLSRLFSR